jgi:hypothetical protein
MNSSSTLISFIQRSEYFSMVPSEKPTTLVTLPLELREKILMDAFEQEIDELIHKDVVCHLYERHRKTALIPGHRKIPKAANIIRRVSTLTMVHPEIADAMEHVPRAALKIYEQEQDRVVGLIGSSGPA